MRSGGTLLGACLLIAAGCAGGEDDAGVGWTVRQAESITSVRGMRVHVDRCEGVGAETRVDGTIRFGRFRCQAGTRAAHDRYDTVAVLYVLHPAGEYEGPGSEHRLTGVRFIGGPGIP